MLVFGIFEYEANIYVVAGTDILLLAALSTPLIFVFVVTPFVKARDVAFEQLSYQAKTDPLTNLPNRRSIDIQLDKFIASTVRHNFYGAVLLLDLDGFKHINDVYGHNAGAGGNFRPAADSQQWGASTQLGKTCNSTANLLEQ